MKNKRKISRLNQPKNIQIPAQIQLQDQNLYLEQKLEECNMFRNKNKVKEELDAYIANLKETGLLGVSNDGPEES